MGYIAVYNARNSKTGEQRKKCRAQKHTTNVEFTPPPPKKKNMRILLKCVSEAANNLRISKFRAYTGRVCVLFYCISKIRILLKCVSGAAKFREYTGRVCVSFFLLHICAIHAISST